MLALDLALAIKGTKLQPLQSFSLGLLDPKSLLSGLARLRQFISYLVLSLSAALLLAKVTPIFGLSGLTIPHLKG